jgi:hypothetical protein
MNPEDQDVIHESRQNLWLLTVAPCIWAAHFLASYIGASIWCGKMTGWNGSIEPVRFAIIGFALVALAGIGFTGWRGWLKHSHGSQPPPHDQDTPEDRHRFLGWATVLLSALSAVATIYVTLSTFFVPGCS